MGSLSKRQNNGKRIGKFGKASPKYGAPLRSIIEILEHSTNLFIPNLVLLECGHVEYSNGRHRARCSQCKKIMETGSANNR